MRAPADRSVAVDARRRRRWADEFATYKTNVLELHIMEWIGQFDPADQDLAARILDVVDFFPVPRIHAAFRSALALLPAWNIDPAKRVGKWRFCQFSSTSGKSGDAMIYNFRTANGMSHEMYDELFISKGEIQDEQLGADGTLVFVDDFVGSGRTAIDAFEKGPFRELVAGVGTVYLVTVAARLEALGGVSTSTGMTVRTANLLPAEDSPLHPNCPHFTQEERERLVFYGGKADKKQPRGFGDCGMVVVFSHNCPNNSLAILHSRSKGWEPLFPRQW